MASARAGSAIQSCQFSSECADTQLTGITYPGGTQSTYVYDGLGRRRSYFEPSGGLTTMLWISDKLIEERS